MTVVLHENPDFEMILKVMKNLRHYDRMEASAMAYEDDPAAWAYMLSAAGPMQWVALLDGEPVAVWGAHPRWLNVWSAWCLTTEKFPKVALSVSRHIRKVLIPATVRMGMIRLDAYCIEPYIAAHRWLRFLGASPEAALANWGKNGETFVSYVWLREPNTQTPERTAGA